MSRNKSLVMRAEGASEEPHNRTLVASHQPRRRRINFPSRSRRRGFICRLVAAAATHLSSSDRQPATPLASSKALHQLRLPRSTSCQRHRHRASSTTANRPKTRLQRFSRLTRRLSESFVACEWLVQMKFPRRRRLLCAAKFRSRVDSPPSRAKLQALAGSSANLVSETSARTRS
jgi:hypothetical protein